MLRLVIDDLRNFRFEHEVARTYPDGIALLDQHRGDLVDELYLDHDLGFLRDGDDVLRDEKGHPVWTDIWPVIEHIERAYYAEGKPFRFGIVYIVTDNPSGAVRMEAALRRIGYITRRINARSLLDPIKSFVPSVTDILRDEHRART